MGVTLNSNALITVEDVFCELDASQDDASQGYIDFIKKLINYNSSAIEEFLDRSLGYEAGRVDLMGSSGGPWLCLPKSPVYQITDVTIVGSGLWAIDVTELLIPRPGDGRVYNKACWPNTAKLLKGQIANDFDPGTEAPCIQITYDAGYNLDPCNPITDVQDLPLGIARAAVLQTVADINQRAKDRSVRREQLMNWSVEYDRGTLFAPDGKDRKGARPFSEVVMGLLTPHARIGDC